MAVDYIGISAIVGDEGTGKTSMALSYPRPIRHFDIDVGGFGRAAWRIDTKDITTKDFPKPIQMNKLLGQTEVSSRIQVPKKIEGVKKLWQDIVMSFVAACQETEVATIVIDSATLLWNICHNSRLEELQEIQTYKWKKEHPNTPMDENEYREKLLPVEYGPANDKMRMLLHTARSFQKNLVLTHYPTDVYGVVPDGRGNMVEGKTGEKTMDGFKETAKLVDLVVWTSIKEVVKDGKKSRFPVCKITKCGLTGMGLAAVGLEVPATFEAVMNLRNMLRGQQ